MSASNYNWSGDFFPKREGSTPPPQSEFFHVFGDETTRVPKPKSDPRAPLPTPSTGLSAATVRRIVRQELADIVKIDVPDTPPTS